MTLPTMPFFASSLVTACCGFNSFAHRAGVRDRATRADRAMDTEMVRANCLYSWPVDPLMNEIGTNTAASTQAMATTGPETSFMARYVASRGDRPVS